MADRAELERLIREGARANTLLQSPELKAAYEDIRDELRGQFFDTDPANTAVLQQIALEQKCLNDVFYRLLMKVQTAKGAEETLERSKRPVRNSNRNRKRV